MNDAQRILEEMDNFDFGSSEQTSPDARRQRRWRMLNPERNRQRNLIEVHNYRARRIGAPGRITLAGWRWVLSVSGDQCLCCGRDDVQLWIDHVISLERGGSNTDDNLQPLCATCNRAKGTKCIDYRPGKIPGGGVILIILKWVMRRRNRRGRYWL
jgi:5-methylcytosine-specific restriction endonuclease McrA